MCMISAEQIRAARALLDVSARELGGLSGVPLRTIQRFERASGIPASRSGTLERVQTALVRRGIEFLGDPIHSPGVRLKRQTKHSS